MTNRQPATQADLGDLVETAKAFAHPARLRLLAMLEGGELCVCQMIAVLGLAPSTVSEHLAVLARGGLLAERKEGKFIFYRLREDGSAKTLLPPLLHRLAGDATVNADRAVAARLRRVPVMTLCAADLDLKTIGVQRPIAQAPARPRA